MKFKLFLHIIFISAFSLAQSHETPDNQVSPYVVETVDGNKHLKTRERLKQSEYHLDENIRPRSFEDEFQEKYTSADYDYTRTKPKVSLWDKLTDRLARFFSNFLVDTDVSSINNITVWVMRILSFGIVGLVLYWAINYLLKKDGNWIFSKKNEEINPEARTITENIHEIDLNALISKYEAEKNYRFATRYQYLKLLKVFNDKKLLTWDPDKTNLDYIRELKGSSHYATFSRLTHIFDYVWYGDFAVDEETYARYKNEFHSLIKNYE
ncbi:DUF4129 domain-containing protein [Weeksellaceae bacterium KMM 9713]|uniref:DUF4129 domain-containing protein n=1 Tax=Profundicola chukchiensis TaxID=2961959 RepID=A0A9X4MZC5_9FLAO|nr:DUF4129 domain-containing protein [Profundicola chukchiensis]MDG4945590.1 DUF4129 domain-containing protein [Profundicola chukchiensis]